MTVSKISNSLTLCPL
ncbi:hypothetical protein RDI58_014392 [Solanum bulbocastanum]|uniref:Uncharacterized protein n=1 Tax=Solanum bulbocastanum TaxID=147425 RepID=A0AAN8TIH7_SOLBU